MERTELQTVIYAISCFLGGLALGGFLEYVILKWLSGAVKRTKSKIDDALVHSFKGLLVFWCTLAGIFLASRVLNGVLPGITNKIIWALLILSLSLFVSRILNALITQTSAGNSQGASIMTYIIRVIVFITGSVIVLKSFGVSVTPLLTALGVGGLAVALALQDTLSNLFSGIQVVASRQIRRGDYIKLSTGEEGYVIDISWKNTSIKMLSNNLIVIPNSKLSSNIFINYALPERELAVLVEVGVSYRSDLGKVEQITIQTAKQVLSSTDGSVKGFEPFIRYHSFADSCISFTVILRAVSFVDQYLIKHEFIKALHSAYEMNQIEIPFPSQNIYIKKSE